ncbi:MAG: hypothetical protein EOM20_21795, partial [Spartobacteria bacterium]|nr:hypothetical protein [Spartobacteria bacterium]
RRNLFGEFGVGLEGRADDYDSESVVRRAKRNFFFAPWHGHTLIGTVYKRFDQRPETAGLSSEEIAAFIRDVNALYPPAALTLEDVAYTHVGVLPAPYRGGRTDCADPSRDTVVVDYGALKMMNGLYAVRGVKYTTAIDVAAKVIRRVAARVGWTLKGAPDAPIYGNEDMTQAAEIMAAARALHLEVDEHTAGRLAIEYGPHYREVLAIAAENASLAERVTAERPVLGAEVVHAVRNEHARHLDDVVLRRTVLGSYGYPGDAAAQTCADIMGSEAGWSPERKTQEIDALKRAYRQRGHG